MALIAHSKNPLGLSYLTSTVASQLTTTNFSFVAFPERFLSPARDGSKVAQARECWDSWPKMLSKVRPATVEPTLCLSSLTGLMELNAPSPSTHVLGYYRMSLPGQEQKLRSLSIQAAARGKSRQGYYVAVFRAGDLRHHGIEIVARPILPEDPGHAELPGLTAQKRLTPDAMEQTLRLTTLVLRVEGPFPPA